MPDTWKFSGYRHDESKYDIIARRNSTGETPILKHASKMVDNVSSLGYEGTKLDKRGIHWTGIYFC